MSDLYSPSSSSLSLPDGSYIYALCASGPSSLAAISSDNSLRRFDRNSLSLLPDGIVKETHSAGVSSLCAAGDGDGERLLATCGKDGTVKIWDARGSGAVAVFAAEKGMPLLSLACDASSHSLVAGTELVKTDAFVLFWDVRAPGKPRRQLVESHNDDVTEVQFHPTRPSVLLSGSTDGLVNIYDTTVEDEDDALLYVVKHSSIHHAGFVSDTAVYALSHDEQFSVSPVAVTSTDNDDEPLNEVKPVDFGDLRPILKAEYVVQVLVDKVGSYVVSGRTSDQSLSLTPLLHTPEYHFEQSRSWTLPGAHGEELVRSVFFDSDSQTIFTSGEDGHVRVWKETESAAQSELEPFASRRPAKPSRKEKGYKPY